MEKSIAAFLAVICALLVIFCAAHSDVIRLEQFDFNQEGALNDWKEMVLNGTVQYELMRQGEEGFIQARSQQACSALYRRIGFKADEYPILRWKWRVAKFPDLSRASAPKDRDDFAARVYVIFPFLSFSSSRFIEYVWSEDVPAGTVLDSPFGDNIKMIVVESGKPAIPATPKQALKLWGKKQQEPQPQPAEEWVWESRDIYKDYTAVFGTEPKRSAGAIAVMCDADGSKSDAESFFDEIIIEGPSKKP